MATAAEEEPRAVDSEDQIFRLFEFERLLNEGDSAYSQANSRSV